MERLYQETILPFSYTLGNLIYHLAPHLFSLRNGSCFFCQLTLTRLVSQSQKMLSNELDPISRSSSWGLPSWDLNLLRWPFLPRGSWWYVQGSAHPDWRPLRLRRVHSDPQTRREGSGRVTPDAATTLLPQQDSTAQHRVSAFFNQCPQ